MKHLVTVAAVTALTLLASSACAPTAQTSSLHAHHVLTLATVADVATFAPQQAGDGHAVQWSQPVYDTLIRQLPDGSFVGSLAQEWSYDEAGTVLTLDLADDVSFGDGTVFDSEAVKINLEATRDGTGPLSTQLASITDINIVDADTVELRLAAPDPSLIRGLSQPSGMIANPRAVGTEELALEPDGTGPYSLDLERTVRGSNYVFVKKDDYWNDSVELPYSELVYIPMTEITARVNALQAGEVDGAYIDNNTMKQLEGAGASVYSYPAAGVVGLFILDREGELQPALKDVRVRQAINYALDREGMLDQFRLGLGTATDQIFNPQTEVYRAELNDRYAFDPDKARALMAEAGYADGITIEIPEIAFPEMTIVGQQLADVGITVNWAKVAPTELLNEMRSGSYPAILMQLQSTDPWQAIQFFVSPTAPWNVLGTSEPELTELINAAQNATEPDAAASYDAINEYLIDNAWFAPFYFPDNIYASSAETVVTPQYQQGVPSIYNYAPAS